MTEVVTYIPLFITIVLVNRSQSCLQYIPQSYRWAAYLSQQSNDIYDISNGANEIHGLFSGKKLSDSVFSSIGVVLRLACKTEKWEYYSFAYLKGI